MKKVFPHFIFSLIIMVFSGQQTFASIFCPPDKTIYCDDGLNNAQLGQATSPAYHPSFIKYKDSYQLNQCTVGKIIRTWYIDVNGNNTIDVTEESCNQTITVLYRPFTTTIEWPENRTFDCVDAIEYESPVVTSGPCDVIGIHVDTTVFRTPSDACYKIFRKIGLVNWCTNEHWEHTQIIKVIEKTAPVILDCKAKVIGVDTGCKGTFTIENSAIDTSICSGPNLYWTVTIDLWGNGDTDYTYGHLQAGQFYVAPTKSGENIKITLPELVGKGTHKVYYSVKDECGNFKACQIQVVTKDLKPPTPYFITYLTSAFVAKDSLTVTPRLFDKGSFDNCSPQKKLRFAFSPDVTDTLRYVTCDNVGFQFYEIYVFDEAGNSEVVEVFLLAYDNGTCTAGRIAGHVKTAGGEPIKNVEMALSRNNESIKSMSSVEGVFDWSQISIYSDYKIGVSNVSIAQTRPDLADLKILQDYIIGAGNLKNYQWIAADANADGKINIADLTLVKKWMVQGAPEANPKGWYIFHGRDSINHLTEIQSLISQVDILNSQGQLGFTAVSRGDVSNANGDEDANSQLVSSADIVMENDHWTMEWNSDHVAGYHLVFKANDDKTEPQFFIDERMLTNSEVIFDASTKKYHIVRIAEDASLSKLVIKNAKGLSFEPKNSLTIDSENVAHSISTDQRIASAVAEVPSIFPNPLMGNEFTLSQDVDRVAVYDSQGRPIVLKRTNFQCQIDATPGIYYVHLSKDQNVTVQKLIIIR